MPIAHVSVWQSWPQAPQLCCEDVVSPQPASPPSTAPPSYCPSDAKSEQPLSPSAPASAPPNRRATAIERARRPRPIERRYHATKRGRRARGLVASEAMSGALRTTTALFVLAALSATVVQPARADAPDKAACAASYEQAQRLRRDRKLVLSREALLVCLQDSCPALLRADCATWLKEVEASLPTVVFEAQGADGAFLADVTVSSGGVVLASRLD